MRLNRRDLVEAQRVAIVEEHLAVGIARILYLVGDGQIRIAQAKADKGAFEVALDGER